MSLLLPWIPAIKVAAVVSIGISGVLFFVAKLFNPSFSYAGKHVVVTGGSSGIGLEIAKVCLKLGSRVTIVARDAARLAKAKAELQTSQGGGEGVLILTASVDASSGDEQVKAALAPCISAFGDADVLINCAGTSIAAEFQDLSAGEFERMFKVNVLGSVFPTRVLLEGMKKKKNGRIVFVSSQVAQAALHGYTAYAASKWALRGLAEALQMEVKPFGIYVSVAYPPDTDTPGYKVEMETKPAITRELSESGQVFLPNLVAEDIVQYAGRGYFGISTGLDGFLLKQLHAGMSPVNNVWEALQPVFLSQLCRVIAVVYVISWDWLVAKHVRKSRK